MNRHEELIDCNAIAVIGMSCRFPQASNPDGFWENLKHGRESLSFFSEEELRESEVPEALYNDPNYVNASCILEDIDKFDHEFFNYTMEEAELIDPQQRFFLECAYETLEDAGYHADLFEGAIGIFGGVRNSGYPKVLAPLMVRLGSSKSFECILGTIADQLCPRTSFTLNLQGPSVGVQTACSSSLVAIHLASESLRNGECDMALAGATAIYVPHKRGLLYEKGMPIAPDGHCRAFDRHTQGCAAGNGTGFVLLKPYENAIADSDQIHAVILGSAVNNDGASKASYRAPSIEGQSTVIHEALEVAGVSAETISYVEANGTGTFIGDSMEVEALTRVFRLYTQKKSYCGIGSVKTNIGHLTQAAGIAGFIKTVLAMKHRQLPPSLNYQEPLPALLESPFYVTTNLSAWQSPNGTLRAGINSFAIGGTNAHVVIESPPEAKAGPVSKCQSHLFTLSAKKSKVLREMILRFKQFLTLYPQSSLADICLTSNMSRSMYPQRFAVAVSSTKELLGKLDSAVTVKKFSQSNFGLILSDQALSGNIQRLYRQVPVFRKTFDQCSLIIETYKGIGLNSEDRIELMSAPFSFARLYSLSMVLISWGVVPSIVMGLGMGELACACLAGEVTLHDALGRLCVQTNPEGNRPIQPKGSSDLPSLSLPGIKLFSAGQGRCYTDEEVEGVKEWRQDDGIIYTREKMESFFTQEDTTLVVAIGEKPERIRAWEAAFPSMQLCTLDPDGENLVDTIGMLYECGVAINWKEFNAGEAFRRISLPTYPFEKKRCWFSSQSMD